jgi:ParB-like chromosome segregation protein Spo0J
MITEKININKIQSNPQNPRIIKDYKFKKLVQSIKDFPEMLELRPIVIDENNVVLGGNMRLKACIEAGIQEVPIKQAKGLTEAQKAEFIIKDNVGFGEWDWDILANEWDTEKLTEWGLDIPMFKNEKDLQNDYKIEIVCKDENDIEVTYNKLIKDGYECRMLTL